MTDRTREDVVSKPEDAPKDRDVIGIDNHGFVGRYRRNKDGGWVPFCRLIPRFNDEDMAGWIELPTKAMELGSSQQGKS